MTAHKEVRQFLREVIAAGMEYVHNDRHYRVSHPRDKRWFIVASSPGSDAAIRRARSDLRRLVEGKPSTHISGGPHEAT